MKEEGKGLGLKWLNFLYGWFVFRIIMLSIGIISSLLQINQYQSMYGSLYKVNNLVYTIIFCNIVSAILKLIAVLTKHKESGYAAINIVLVWDLFYWFIWGLQYDLFRAIFAPLLVSLFIVPTFFYLKKRKFVYGISEDNDAQKSSETIPTKCGICDKEDDNLIRAKFACDWGTSCGYLCADCIKKYHAESVETKNEVHTESDIELHDEEIKFCRKCGNKLLSNSKSCSKCGTEVMIFAKEE